MSYYLKPNVLWGGADAIALDQHTVIEASAGTGKTYTLEHLFVSLILERGMEVDQILVVTFTRRAAAEMKERIRALLTNLSRPGVGQGRIEPGDESKYWKIEAKERGQLKRALHAFDRAEISTIHGFAQDWLRRYAFEAGQLFSGVHVDSKEVFERAFGNLLRSQFSVDETEQRWLRLWYRVAGSNENADLALMDALARVHDSHAVLLPERGTQELMSYLARAEAVPKPDSSSAKTAVIQYFLAKTQQAIQTLKLSDGLYTYEDMLRVVDSVVQRSSPNPMLEGMRKQYRCALIDEFQDTDAVQWRIFKRVFMESPDHVLFLIGDPKQSIYGFRGADIETYRSACEEVLGGREPVRLLENYRSTSAMIDAYNGIFEGYFSVSGTYDHPVRCGKVEMKAELAGQEVPAISIFNVDGKSVEEKRSALREAFADEMQRILGKDGLQVMEEGKMRPVRASDIFVLTKRRVEGTNIAESLRARGIPFAFYRQEGLFQTQEARDIATLLMAIADPRSKPLRRHALITPFFGIPLEDVERVDSANGGIHRAVFDRWQALARRRYYNVLFENILRTSGIIRRAILLDTSERKLTNYEHLFELIAEESARREYEVHDLAIWFKKRVDGSEKDSDEDVNLQRLETDRDSVQIMTIHRSKGLEAHVVFLYDEFSRGMNRGFLRLRLPDGRLGMYLALNRDYEGAHEEYERHENERLYYVALTRAISKMYIPKTNKEDKCAYNVVLKRLRQLKPDEQRFEERSAESRSVPRESEISFVETLRTWRPPHTSTLARPPMSQNTVEELKTRVLRMESYSKLKASADYEGAALERPEDETDVEVEDDVKDLDAWGFINEDHLPGGKRAGSMLHEILEYVDFEGVAGAQDLESWIEDPAVSGLIERVMRKYRFDLEAYGEYVRRSIWHTLRTCVDDGFDAQIAPLAAIDVARMRREVRFVFAIPEKGNIHMRQTKGYAEGFVDLLFEHRGRMYFADWKSDVLERGDYSYRKLRRRVVESYPAQATIYTLAIVKMLGIADAQAYDARFGGFYYFFVRGMDGSSAGIYYERPSWESVHDLLERLEESDKQSWTAMLAGGLR